MIRVGWMPRADMPVAIHYSLIGQNPIRGHNIREQTFFVLRSRGRWDPRLLFRCFRFFRCAQQSARQQKAGSR